MLNVKFLAVLLLCLSSVVNSEGNGVRGLKKIKRDAVDQTEDASLSRTIGHTKTKKHVSSTPRSTPKDVGFGPTKGNVASSKRSQTPVDNDPAPGGRIDNPVTFEEDSELVSFEDEASAPEDTDNPAKGTNSLATDAPGEGENGRSSSRGRKRTKAAKTAKRNGRAKRGETAVPEEREVTRAPSFTDYQSDAPSTAFSGTDSPSSEPTVFRRAIIADAETETNASASTTVRASSSSTTRGSKSEKSNKLII